jgi:hypothetical protein
VVDGLHTHLGNRMMKPPVVALSGAGWGWPGVHGGGDLTSVNARLFGIVTTNPPCTMNIC